MNSLKISSFDLISARKLRSRTWTRLLSLELRLCNPWHSLDRRQTIAGVEVLKLKLSHNMCLKFEILLAVIFSSFFPYILTFKEIYTDLLIFFVGKRALIVRFSLWCSFRATPPESIKNNYSKRTEKLVPFMLFQYWPIINRIQQNIALVLSRKSSGLTHFGPNAMGKYGNKIETIWSNKMSYYKSEIWAREATIRYL